MARIVNQEEHLNNPMKDFIVLPTPASDKEKEERAKALGQIKKN